MSDRSGNLFIKFGITGVAVSLKRSQGPFSPKFALPSPRLVPVAERLYKFIYILSHDTMQYAVIDSSSYISIDFHRLYLQFRSLCVADVSSCTDRAGENREQRAQDKCLNTKIVFHIYEPYNFVQLSYEKNVLLSKTSLPE